jgi:SAM-dependent methyltransferase
MLRGRPLTRRVAIDDVGEHNRKMWERLAEAGIPYTRPLGKPPRDARGKRRFLDDLTHGRLRGIDLEGKRVLSLAGGGGWDAVLFAELGATTTLFDISKRQLTTVRALARERGTKLRFIQGDMRDLSAFADGEFDVVSHHHSMVFVPDAERVIAEAARILAPGGTYVFSTMHPVALRMQETWTGTGWGFKQRYFDDGSVPFADALWEFGSVKVEARTLEYGHRTSDLVNACAKNGLLVDGLWEYSPSYEGGEPGSPDELERGLVGWRLPLVAQRPRLVASRNAPAERGARFGVLRHDLVDLTRRDRDVHGPADTEDLFGEELVALRIPVGLAQPIERGQAEVVRDDARDLAIPGARLGRPLQLLIDRGRERHPHEGADQLDEVLH